MSTLLSIAVGVGLAVGLLFTELFGLAAGGLIVPGYVAVQLHRPLTVALTFGVGLATYGLVRLAARHLILFGRRRTALTLLLGYLLGFGTRGLLPQGPGEAEVIGFIIPGLIALWMHRQGVVQTVVSVILVSGMVRLILIAALGEGARL